MTYEDAIAEFRKNLNRGMEKPAFKLAIDALNKERPIPPYRDDNGGYPENYESFFVCGKCDMPIPEHCADERMPFCPECGQRIDWSVVNG